MNGQGIDNVSIELHNMLTLLPPSAHTEHHRIFKVSDQLRKENVDAYEPKIIAIGPYHRGKNNLQAMEEHKLRYLQQFLDRSNETRMDRFVTAMRDLEERARQCYAESINLSKDEFVKMILLDGCFIAHFFRKYMFQDLPDVSILNDPVFNRQTVWTIREDLMLMENQLPFFILVQLIDMTKCPHPNDNITDLVHNCLKVLTPLVEYESGSCPQVSTDNTDHILGFMHEIWCSSFAKVVSQKKEENQDEDWEFIKCVTELQDAGVEFRKSSSQTISLFDIKFENGVMEIPPFDIQDASESIFRNLIAYELYCPWNCPSYVTDYTTLMDCLIN